MADLIQHPLSHTPTSALLVLLAHHHPACSRAHGHACQTCVAWYDEINLRVPPRDAAPLAPPIQPDEDRAVGNGVFEFHRGNISAVRHVGGVSLCHRRSGEAVGRWVVVDDGDIDDAIAALTAVRRAR